MRFGRQAQRFATHGKSALREILGAMSEEALDTVRRYMPAFERAPVEARAEFWHPEITWRAIQGAPDDVGVISGREALRDYYEQWIDTFADIRAELVDDLIGAGENVVVAVTRIEARMKHSDASVEMTVAIVFTVRDDQILSGREYATCEEALEADSRELRGPRP